VVAGLPDAEQWLKDAAPAGTENDWAAAALTRASARLHSDRDGLTRAAQQFAQIGAEYERAQTEELLRRL
jgi:hypothetical protein